jgi:nucleotide-binding universal stress UspA family protein
MQFRRVVIGVDFTDASLAAVRWAALHFAPEAEVVLVHALPESEAPSYLRPFLPSPVELSASLAPVFHGALRGLAEIIGAERTRVYVTTGSPAVALATAADQLGADLLCVGRGTRRRGAARFGATTAVRLLSRTRVPALIVPVGRHEAPARVVAAVDDRPGGEHVAEVACGLAAAFEARVEALHALDGDLQDLARVAGMIEPTALGTHHDAGVDEPGDDEHDERHPVWHEESEDGDAADVDARWLRRLARRWLGTLLERAGAPARRWAPVVRFGEAGHEIVAHASERDADLVVIGRGGDRTDADPTPGVLHVGSTTRLVTWAAPCPVLVLPLDRTSATTGAGSSHGAGEARVDVGVIRRSDGGRIPPGMRLGVRRRDAGGRGGTP